MTDTISDKELNELESEAKNIIESKELIMKAKESQDGISKNDKSKEDEVLLEGLGTFKRARKEDIDDVFEKLAGTIFQLKTCMFKVTYIHEGNKRFTAELVNP